MNLNIAGTAKVDLKTKELIQRITSSDIAIIYHEDLDYACAYPLVQKKVKAIINCASFISGKYPSQGSKYLMDAGIPIYEHHNKKLLSHVKENDYIKIVQNMLITKTQSVELKPFTKQTYLSRWKKAQDTVYDHFPSFIDNTLEYLHHEKYQLSSYTTLPVLKKEIIGKTVVIVIRGPDYMEDLFYLSPFIKKHKPILIGVDGGADAFFHIDQTPDIIFGDMDSVSDDALYSASDIIVHAYPNGSAPGEMRIKKMNLAYQMYTCLGMSEDAVMLMAYFYHISKMILVGSHSSMIDLMEKNRQGMSSTLLVRMLTNSKVIDAKGYHKLS